MRKINLKSKTQMVVLMSLALLGVSGISMAAAVTATGWAQFVGKLPSGNLGLTPGNSLGILPGGWIGVITQSSVGTNASANIPYAGCPRGIACGCSPYAMGGVSTIACPIIRTTCQTGQSTITQGQGLGCNRWLVMLQSETNPSTAPTVTFSVYRYYANGTISLVQQVTMGPNQTPPSITANTIANSTATGVIGPGQAKVCLPQATQQCLIIDLFSAGYNANGQEFATLSLTGTNGYYRVPSPTPVSCDVCMGTVTNSSGGHYCGPAAGSGQVWPSYRCYPGPVPATTITSTGGNGSIGTSTQTS